MKKIIYLIVFVLLAIGAVTYLKDINRGVLSGYKNTTYVVEGQPVTLVNGHSDVLIAPGSATKVATNYFGNEAVGDLNGDSTQDVAFLITQNTGGSGTFYYIVSALRFSKGFMGTDAVLLGDRIAPQTTVITDGVITVNYADRNAGDSMTTAPSLGVSKYFKVKDQKLIELNKFRSDSQGLVFFYPIKLPTKYISAVDWPPKITVIGGTYTCSPAGVETERAGKTEKRTINGRSYCVTLVRGGAAGSIYDQYAYAKDMNGQIIILTFSTRSTQCGNYEETEKLECESERGSFNIDKIIDEIFLSLREG